MTYPLQTLSALVSEITTRNRKKEELAVFSVTNSDGFVPSGDYFKKQVFSKDLVNYKVVPPGCFAYNPSRVNVGSIDYLQQDSPVLVSPLYIVFRTAPELAPAYLKRFLLSEMGITQIRHLTQGAVRDSLKFSGLKKIEIPLPTLDEQKRIVETLGKADAVRNQRQESIQLMDRLLQSVFIEMFGDPIRNSKNLPTDALSNLSKLERGKFTPRPRNDPSYFGGAHPFIQTGDITRSNGRITTWTQTLNEKGAAVSKEFGAGTVVIAIVGATLGETAIVETPVYCPDSIIGITPFPEKATPEFIEFLLRLWRPRLKELAPDAARANLNLERLRPLQALAPDINEQERFSNTAKCIRGLLLSNFENRDQLHNLFSSLQQRAFRGELDLSRLKLEDEAELVAIGKVPEPVVIQGKYRRPGAFIAPPEIEAQMKAFEQTLDFGPGDSIPWSEDYFKYRTLSQVLRPPFNCAEIMEKVHNDMPDATYEDVRRKLFQYLEEGILEQQFDDESREIVFAPRA